MATTAFFDPLVESLSSTAKVSPFRIKDFLRAYDLPHKELFDRMTEDVRDHTEKVVQSMYELIGGSFAALLDSEALEATKGNDLKIGELLQGMVDSLNNESKSLLLWTALYHDIGKVITEPRHGPEGADVIKDTGKSDRERFYDVGFRRRDIGVMADLIRFHDYFGATGTGETSYLSFAEVLFPVSNIALMFEEKFLDLLFLVNLADIAGTFGTIGYEPLVQLILDYRLIRKAHVDISRKVYKDIFKDEPGEIQEGELHERTLSARDMTDVMLELQRTAENSTVERLRRLLRAGFARGAEVAGRELGYEKMSEYRDWVTQEYQDRKVYETSKPFEKWFTGNDIAPVKASLHACNVGQNLYVRFALVCKLDYLLGFLGELFAEMLMADVERLVLKGEVRSPHDFRRDLALTLVLLADHEIRQFGCFTTDNTRIGLGFERLKQMDRAYRKRLLRRLAGEDGVFKHAEACTKLRNSTNMWVITM